MLSYQTCLETWCKKCLISKHVRPKYSDRTEMSKEKSEYDNYNNGARDLQRSQETSKVTAE